MYSMSVYNCTMLKTINATKFRNNFKDTMAHVKKSKSPLIVTERNIPVAILVDIDEYEDSLSLKDKTFLASIKRARAEYKKGSVIVDVFADVI
jgi:prevent-host-death family protein